MVGPGASSDGDGLLAEYGGLREEQSAHKQAQRLGELVVRSLRRSGISAELRDDGPMASIAFRHSGHPCVIGLARSADPGSPACEEFVREAQRSAPGVTVIVLSMTGFPHQRVPEITGTDSGSTVLWDHTHLEAVLCGLVSLPELLEASVNAAVFRNAPYESLAWLLTEADDDTSAPRMTTPDRMSPPGPANGSRSAGSETSSIWAAGSEASGTGGEIVLTGENRWPQPTGIASLGPGRLAVVTPAGLIELDAAGGATSWLTRLPGCMGEPLVTADGSVLVVCERAVARVSGSGIEAVAGEFDGSPRLLAGPGGDPWVLSGHGSDLPGEGTLALTRLGDRPGDQHRYGIDCADGVRAAIWLGGLRFFLAASGRSAIIDLSRSTCVTDADWIESPWAPSPHLALADPSSVVTATVSSDDKGPGARVTLFRTDLRARFTEPVTDLALNGISGLCVDADGTGYLLGDVSGRADGASGAGRKAPPVLVSLPGLRPPEARGPVPAQVVMDGTSFSRSRWDAVRMAARGQEQDYELDPRPIDQGGQAEVIGARHRQTGQRVAFKRLRRRAPHAVARMRREIEAAQVLGGNAHVMPVLDYGPRYDWFVMPLAEESAATAQPSLRDPKELRALVTAICSGLRHAHAIGWLHRDIKPANLLRLDGSWTVADWGLVRRPLGLTTETGRTQLGAAFGTIGFGAPELSADPHQVDERADIYSIGQIIGWAVTQRMPLANTPLLPPDGPWRQVVRVATQHDPERRPVTVDDLLQLIAEELDYKLPDTGDLARRLAISGRSGDRQSAAELFALAARYPDDRGLYTETLPAMTRDSVAAAVTIARHDVLEVARAISGRADDTGLDEDQAARITTWLHWIQDHAGTVKDLELLEEAARAVLAWDARWNTEHPQRQIAEWLPLLRGDQAAAVARALHETPGSARHFTSLLRGAQTDERLQRAIRAALTPTPAAGSTAAPGCLTHVDSGRTQVDGVTGPYQLPADTSGFVGRDEELVQISRLLDTGRLVTVTGPSGSGKTRLALRAAAQAAVRFRDGACLIDLSAARDPGLFPRLITAALGLGDIPPLDVIGHLLHREMLIVLDGCDHLTGPCADFASSVMRATAGVTLLATSGQPLNVTGERCLDLEPLAATTAIARRGADATDPGADATDPGPVPASPGPVPGPESDPASGDANSLYTRCSPAEQSLWQRISVFSGPFDADAAADVCADTALDSHDVLGGLATLAARSVVTVHQSPRGARYQLPDRYRELGAGELRASGQEQVFRDRHLGCYQAMSRRFATHFLGHDGAVMFQQMRASYPDLRAALEYASDDGRGETGVGLAVALAYFWLADGQLDEGRHWLGRIAESCPYPSLELAETLIVRGHLSTMAGDARDGVTDIREGIRIATAMGDATAVAQGQLHLTQALTFAGHYPEAAAAGTEAYHLLRRLGDDHGGLRLQAELALLETLAGNPEHAATRCERTLLKTSSAGDWIRGYLLLIKGFAQFQQTGLEPESAASAREALRIYQEFGDRTGIAHALEMLGWLAARAGDHHRAAWLLGAADTLWEKAGSRLSNVPALEEQHAATEAAARRGLSQQRFASIAALGADSPLDEVITAAVAEVSIQGIS